MGLFFRKSLNLGKALKLNFSKSGIGFSFGVKGLRFGKTPTGKSYMHAGRGGLYFRKQFSDKKQIRENVPDEIANIEENYKNVKVRVNTNGMPNMIHKRNIVPELAKNIDAVSVSLNAENDKLYDEISQPQDVYKGAYSRVKEFIWYCAQEGLETTATIVTGYKDYKPDIQLCEQIAKNLGAKFRVREWLDNGY